MSNAVQTAVAAYLSGRNRIINGAMRVSQRPGASFASGTSGYAGPDRFKVINSGAGGTILQQRGNLTINGSNRPCIVNAASVANTDITGSNYWAGISQIIEGCQIYDLIGQFTSLSFWLYASLSGAYSISITDSTGTYSYVTSINAVASTLQFVSLEIPPIPAAANVPNSTAQGLVILIGALNTGSLQCPTASLGAWQAGNFISAQGALNWGATLNASINIAEVQFEPGPATPFEHEDYEITLLRSQRYYQTGSFVIQFPGVGLGIGVTNTQTMRAAPSVIYSGITYGSASGLTLNTPTPSAFGNQFTTSASGGYCGATWSASAEF